MWKFYASMLSLVAVVVADYDVKRISGIVIKTVDGFDLRAGARIPVSTNGEQFPVVIFANSWGLPQFEYILKVEHYAKMGFVALEYETRGWFEAGGEIGTAGPLDQQDTSTVIDFVLNQTEWHADPSKVALAGISYGGGLALLGAANDKRVSAVVAMSAWANIYEALNPGNSPNLVWGSLLIALAYITGKPSEELTNIWNDLLNYQNMSGVEAFAAARSPSRLVETINERQVPVFISSNLEDGLFMPQDMLRFYQTLTGPKQMLLNQGIHATAELFGDLGAPSFIWDQADLWLLHYFKGVGPTPPLGSVTYQLRNKKTTRLFYPSWPAADVSSTTYYLSPPTLGSFKWGGLSAKQYSTTSTTTSLHFSRDSGMNNGIIPVLSDLGQIYVDIPIISDLSLVGDFIPGVSNRHAVLWRTEPFGAGVRLCGDVNLQMPVVPNAERWQLVAYLYDVENVLGSEIGTLISHGTQSCWNCTAGAPVELNLNLHTLCYDVKSGHRVVLGVDMFSDLYKPANVNRELSMTFSYGQGSKLTMDIADM